MSVNTVISFGYGVRVRVTDAEISANYELDDFEVWLKENHPLLVTAMSGNAYDDSKEMTRWVFIKSTFAQNWGWEEELTHVEDGIYDDEAQAIMDFILTTGMAYGRVGYAMIRQEG